METEANIMMREKGMEPTICTKCNLYKLTPNPKIDTVIPEHLDTFLDRAEVALAFIAECPAEEEEKQGIPLVGPAGTNFNEALQKAGIDRSKVIVGNTVRCRTPNNRTPSKKEAGLCYKYLIRELKQYKPSVIVCLGLVATKLILKNDKFKMTDGHGRTYSGKNVLGFDCVIIPTWHPSPTTFAYTPARKSQMIADIRSAKTESEKDYLGSTIKRDWVSVVVTDLKGWTDVLPEIQKSKCIVYDIESTGLDANAEDAKITNFGLAPNSNYGISVVCEDWKPDEFEAFKSSLKELMDNKEIGWVAHYGQFDAKYLMRQWGMAPKTWAFDTCLGHSIVKPGESNRLKDISWEYTPEMGGYEHELTKDLLSLTAIERTQYNIDDCICTYRIMLKQIPLIKDTKFDRGFLYWNIILPAAQVLTEMEHIGVQIDEFSMNQLAIDYQKRLENVKMALYMESPIMVYNSYHGSFNPNSSKQIATVLFDDRYCNFKPNKWSEKTKKPSCDKEVLTYFKERGSKICELILEYHAASKLHSTYLVGMKKNIVKGRVHTHYHLDVAITGRTSSSDPNCQNIPKTSDIKSIFVPDPGFVFIDADYKQMELLVSTFYTQDEVMIEAIQSGDAHSFIAKKFFGLEDVTEENRRYIKSINFGVLYGMGNIKLAKQLGIEPHEARKLIDDYFKLLKKTKAWVDDRRAKAEKNGYVVSKLGRVRFYKTKTELHGSKGEYNSAVNHPIQSVASDIMLYGLIKWRNYLIESGLYQDKAYIALQVHDSITTCVREDLAIELAVAKKKILEEVHFKFMTLPLAVDIEVGYSWGDLKKLDI